MIFSGRSVAEKNEVTAVRKKIRPTMRFLRRINFREQGRRAALRRHPVQPVRAAKKYHPVTIPRAATRLRHFAQGLRTAARSFDPEKFTVREISDRVAIGRPERGARTVGANQRLRAQ